MSNNKKIEATISEVVELNKSLEKLKKAYSDVSVLQDEVNEKIALIKENLN